MNSDIIKNKINTKSVFAYLLSPQLGRRVKNLSINTKWLALLLLNIFQILRLLPAHSYYTTPETLDNVSIRGVLGLAANNLKFDLKHSDQLIVYAAILLAMVLLVAQFALLAFVISTNMAHAQLQFMGFFQQPVGLDLSKDIAFSMLDQIFGVPGLYNTTYAPTSASTIPPFTLALQGTFKYYNFAMSTVAVFLLLYFLFVVIVETVQDGTPFGQRFASGYVPFRLIIALAFLVPTYHGFSTGQHLVLNVAKVGGIFATNTWIAFGGAVENPLGNGQESVIPMPPVPDTTAFIEGLVLANMCAAYHRQQYYLENSAAVDEFGAPIYDTELSIERTSATNINLGTNEPLGTQPHPIDVFLIYDVKEDKNKPAIYNGLASYASPDGTYYTDLPTGATAIDKTNIQTLLNATANRDIRLRFGQIHPNNKGNLKADGTSAPVKGGIKPTCGEIVIPGSASPQIGPSDANSAIGAWRSQLMFVSILLWYEDYFTPVSQRLLAIHGLAGPDIEGCDIPFTGLGSQHWANCNQPPPSAFYSYLFNYFKKDLLGAEFKGNVYDSIKDESQQSLSMTDTNNIADNQDLYKYGWAGAGMWYNRISDTYSAYKDALKAPYVKSYPEILNVVAKYKRAGQLDTMGIDLFDPELPDGRFMQLPNPKDLEYAKMMNEAISTFVAADTSGKKAKEDKTSSFTNFINLVFGLEGVFNLRENGDVHPFGQLVGAGKGLIDSSIAAFAGTIFSTSISGFLSSLGFERGAKFADMASAIESMAATVGLTAGIILFYVIPMTPFMYFFLAAGRWVKSIFEAMIAVPLWAMAHIRIDGTGLPGVAGNGYFLVFEIFLRPVLTLFGLLASIATYGALMVIFNDVFDLVVDNLANNDISSADPDYIDEFRGVVDMFFYTVLYAIVAYMMAMASFKLIDLIPDSILRWMGAGVKTFSDESGNIAEGLNSTISIQGAMTARHVSSISEGLGEAGGIAAGGGIRSVMQRR